LFRFEASISTSQTLVERRCLRLDGWTLIYAAFEGSDSIAASPKGKGTAPLQFIVGIAAAQVEDGPPIRRRCSRTAPIKDVTRA